jgi:hypothetical protein
VKTFHVLFGIRLDSGRKIVFQKYRVARRLGTESVRRRLLGRLRVTAAMLSGKLEPTG